MSAELVERARLLAEEQLAGLPTRLAHVRGVAGVAQRLQGCFDVPTGRCLVAAAWLHDVGYAPAVRRTGFHPVDGAAFVRSAGFDELIVSLVAFHSGAPAEAAERGIGVLSTFTEPPRDVLDALTFCDLTTGPDGSKVTPEGRLREVLTRYGPDDAVYRAIDYSRGELLATVGRVQRWS